MTNQVKMTDISSTEAKTVQNASKFLDLRSALVGRRLHVAETRQYDEGPYLGTYIVLSAIFDSRGGGTANFKEGIFPSRATAIAAQNKLIDGAA